jgi:hypothetical protein
MVAFDAVFGVVPTPRSGVSPAALNAPRGHQAAKSTGTLALARASPNSSKGTAVWRNICEMALTSWKAFPFFTVSQVSVPADGEGSYVFDVCMVHA